MKSAASITSSLFYRELARIGFFRPEWGWQTSTRTWRMGLCVSGGPDSMALAYLLQNMVHPLSPDTKVFLPYAFVVDHAARDGSHEEAIWVKAQLEALGIETQISRLVWPARVDPKAMRGFEQEARVRRYRALASMAATNGIHDLCTGHHQDDQVETVLLRLLRDRTINPNSFQGMPKVTSLPGCEDLQFAAQRSVTIQPSLVQERNTSPSLLKLEQFFTGVKLHRPLLSFHKSQLLATCDHHGIPYVQDETNFDPEFTSRNAVRHLRTAYRLPKALQHGSLLNTLLKARNIQDDVEKSARQLCENVTDFGMHSESGVLYLRLKPLPPNPDESHLRGFSYLMCRLVALLSPLPSGSCSTMLARDLTEKLHVMCQRSSVESTVAQEPVVFNKVSCRSLPRHSLDRSCVLLFSRQSMSLRERKSSIQTFELRNNTPENSDREGELHSHPLLWDNRFWIEVTANSEEILKNTTVRAYNRMDAFFVKQALAARGSLPDFEKTLSTIAPGDARYTLPILLFRNEIVAFPTLDLAISPRPLVRWQVRYPRDPRSTQFLFPDLRNGDIKSWNSILSTGHGINGRYSTG